MANSRIIQLRNYGGKFFNNVFNQDWKLYTYKKTTVHTRILIFIKCVSPRVRLLVVAGRVKLRHARAKVVSGCGRSRENTPPERRVPDYTPKKPPHPNFQPSSPAAAALQRHTGALAHALHIFPAIIQSIHLLQGDAQHFGLALSNIHQV